MTYNITIQKRVLKFLDEVKEPDHTKLRNSMSALAYNPRPSGYIKLKGRAGFRIRVGDYRVIYHIFDNTLLIDVVNLGHRKDIYH